jgi:hypothetical protein
MLKTNMERILFHYMKNKEESSQYRLDKESE